MNDIDVRGKKVALIGGSGFIGHNLALRLAELGAEVHVIDSLQVNNLGAFSNAYNDPNKALYLHVINERLDLLRDTQIPLHVIDARDYQLLSRTLAEIKPDAVVQLAAIAHANRANKDPFSTFDHSFRTLENALDYARGEKCHFIYFSSSMVYGNFDGEAVYRRAALRADRHLRRAQVRRREAGHRLQPGVRSAVHDRAALGALRRALRQPARRAGVHRERAARHGSERQRRRLGRARLHLHRGSGAGPGAVHRETGGAQPDLQPDLWQCAHAQSDDRYPARAVSRHSRQPSAARQADARARHAVGGEGQADARLRTRVSVGKRFCPLRRMVQGAGARASRVFQALRMPEPGMEPRA